jgi:hypothetical protein
MQSNIASTEDVEFHTHNSFPNKEAHSSGVSWGAVIGGAFVAAAFYLILLALGAGLGLSALSPWSDSGLSASAVGAAALVWLIVTEVIASAMGGYLTGRLRTKWALIHTDEVYFRDTANGFLAWAVALVISVSFLASAGAAMVGASRSPGAAANTAGADLNAYYVDTLFRSDRAPQPQDVAARVEAARIFDNALRENQVPASDGTHLAQLIATTTGISQSEAQKRIADVFAQARQTEDTARKVTSRSLLWFFVALMLGALSASYAATIGGRQRDHIKAV